ncbi:MAG: hypothetical protein V3U78_01085 [Thiotrichaceae bacterium]
MRRHYSILAYRISLIEYRINAIEINYSKLDTQHIDFHVMNHAGGLVGKTNKEPADKLRSFEGGQLINSSSNLLPANDQGHFLSGVNRLTCYFLL